MTDPLRANLNHAEAARRVWATSWADALAAHPDRMRLARHRR